MREGHKHLNLKESDFDTIVKHLGATLTEIGCPGELIGKIAGALVALKDEVLNKWCQWNNPGFGINHFYKINKFVFLIISIF